MEPIGAELEQMLVPVAARACENLRQISEEGKGCRTSLGIIISRAADGACGVRYYATAGEVHDPAEITWYSDSVNGAFGGVLARLYDITPRDFGINALWESEQFRALDATAKLLALFCAQASKLKLENDRVGVPVFEAARALNIPLSIARDAAQRASEAVGWALHDSPAGPLVCL